MGTIQPKGLNRIANIGIVHVEIALCREIINIFVKHCTKKYVSPLLAVTLYQDIFVIGTTGSGVSDILRYILYMPVLLNIATYTFCKWKAYNGKRKSTRSRI